MSVSREWNSLKAAWVILLLFLAVRVFLSGQFLLTPEEANYWQASQYPLSSGEDHSPVLNGAIRLSTALFGNTETAVRLPAVLALTLAAIYMTLLAANMFSWHTALHVTLISQSILQLNVAALVLSPYSLLLPCWAAVCYHSSQAMHDNRIEQWLFAGFWFGVGLLCQSSMILLLLCLILCFVLIRPFRTCLLYAGPWLAILLSLGVFLSIAILHENISLPTLAGRMNLRHLARDLIPDVSYSLGFMLDQLVLITPFVLLLILAAWLNGGSKRHLCRPDVQFLTYTSFPLFLLYLVFPVFDGNHASWSTTTYITAIVLIAGLHSSTRSSFKGSPNRRWIFALVTAYCITVPLVLKTVYPHLPIPVEINQLQLEASGWDLLGKEMEHSVRLMPSPEETFIFSMEPRIASELAFYMPGNPRAVSLDYRTRKHRRDFLEKELLLAGQDGLGLVSTTAALDQAELLFNRVELERELTLYTHGSDNADRKRTFYVIRGFGFHIR
ncbi:MAG: glycosyltransferase family 39 protein [Desulfobulbaceae bacterium]|nr:glycosyltransferase family 39 protein [Desulfobulbaceae bacterium]